MKKIIYIVVALIVFSACTEDFTKINTNPNNPEVASESLLLPTVLFDLSNLMVNESYNFGDIISQYGARYEFNDLDIYRWQADDRFWSPMYTILQNIQDIKKIADENGDVNYKAVGLILESYIYSVITDAYGAVPMSEANRTKEGIITPVYDSQEAIYTSIFEKLENANQIINVSGTINGDNLYNGNMMQWKKFANSLRLRLLLRISDVKNVSSEVTAIVNDFATYPIFESNADNATYAYSGSLPDISPIVLPGGGRAYDYYLLIPTKHFVDLLATNNDPRLDAWVSPKEGTNDRTLGVIPGQSLSDIGRPADFSRRANSFYESATMVEGIFMTYSELNFILAEATEKGLVSSRSAKSYYDTAVIASFEQWNVNMPTDFLSVTAPYDNTTDRLYEQKWLALYHSGVESWFDWKRTGKPSFIQAGSGNINGDMVPVRLRYPSLEQSVNTANYEAASSAMGSDDINASSWWW
ncbi:SusD/RagB family nutrient-binding outer membrane lipoprotein [Tenacibaculum sp. M341]|uniref:SusD/RagB family nutrient-binding outer membrane lipoprotein n=1 Tax=Tenacibaculum sp. M341 TaxID=2530339 RepID=UPI00104E31E5|nr:SusD/RagB family nutrient-binding outer membrane lipoprotein [Tenacibaculum sp. M341]TCI94916.1 SusD/RagB family nutrient-binding outer membrane lipoprotein [Tenacibaculum sp. M341]